MFRSKSLVLVCAALLQFGIACHTRTADEELAWADAKSGADGKRSLANVLQPNQPVTDEVNYPEQDKSDWFVINLAGKSGVAAVSIHWDNVESELNVDVFDEIGKQIQASPSREPGANQKMFLVQIDHGGIYYFRVSAANKLDHSVYTLLVHWELPVVAAPEPPPPKREPRRPLPPQKHERREAPSHSIQGRIVSAYREEGSFTLYIDKGSAAGLKPGMTGSVLEGPSGADPLEGGEFQIIKVLDANKSVAKCTIHSLGKNSRVSIDVAE